MASEADMKMTRHSAYGSLATALVAFAVVVAACGGGGTAATPSPTAAPASVSPATASPGASATAGAPTTPPASATPAPTGPATLDAPAQIPAAAQFAVAWTGPAADGDYVTIVAKGATKWTTEPYFYTNAGSPGKLVAPTTAGDYELWYVSGSDDSITARRPITVAAFVGTLDGPATVEAGTVFNVAWTGPDGPSDYVTIVAAGAEKWINESYFYTKDGTPGKLISSIVAGSYELWYVTGLEAKTMVRRPITVTPFAITLKAPASVTKGSSFAVEWTGPNGPSDYITIAPKDSPVGTYLDYAYTKEGSPVSIKAPDVPGAYEIRYASDRVKGTFASIPITVK